MSLLEVTNLSHGYLENQLYKNASFTLNKKEHVGIVGQNGTGKSTLIKICTNQVLWDEGSVKWQNNVTVGYLDQYAEIDKSKTVLEFLKTAYEKLYEIEKRMNEDYEKVSSGELKYLDRALESQEYLENHDFYSIDIKIEQMASGLGLDAIGLDKKISNLSGGQRAKVILGKLLLEKPDVLLLDEPTNFLDKEHVDFLTNYLNSIENAFMVVSHHQEFLENVANRILDIDNSTITKYHGNYSEFKRKKEALREDYKRKYISQQREIKKTEDFIRKNIAGRNSKMAKGRRKQLERMDRLQALEEKEIKPTFSFPSVDLTNTVHLNVDNLTIGYDTKLLENLNFSVRGGEKVVMTGFNGIGKSTLLKTILGKVDKIDGNYNISSQAKVEYFQQDLVWEDKTSTPIDIISDMDRSLSEKQIRALLFRCGISSKQAKQEIGSLSGGEQCKVKLCQLSLRKSNFLIMDEPTNHLDKNAKDSLKDALRNYSGTVLLVSHEEEFYRDLVEREIKIGLN